jgi:membrane protein implicated in regulation of membrane protease activity
VTSLIVSRKRELLRCTLFIPHWFASSAMTWFVIFAASVFALYFWRQHRAREREMNSPLAGHRSGHSHIGQVIVLEQGLQNGTGRIRLGNREWPIRGPNLPAGAKARVTGVDGTVLLVDRVAA